MTRRIVLMSTADANSNEGRIVRNLHDVLQQTLTVELVMTPVRKAARSGAIAGVFRQIGHALRSNTVVIHSPFMLSAPGAVTARLLRKPVIAFVWDSYPVRIGGQPYTRRLMRRMLNRVEDLVLRIVTRKVIPNSDFYLDPRYHDARTIPFWHGVAHDPAASDRKKPPDDRPRKIAFAGQINATRGLAEALAHLDKILQRPAEVHLFSRDEARDICATPYARLTVHHHGFLPHADMLQRLGEMDFGLVSLHPQFEGPGFPSKTLDYLSLCLPVLYFGRPLPAYAALLQHSGAGMVVTGMTSLSLNDLDQPFADMATARQMFSDSISAKAGAFDSVFADP